MNEFIIQVLSGIVCASFLTAIGFGWRIVSLGKSNNDILIKHNGILESILEEMKVTSLRVDVHDILMGDVYGTSVSSKMILSRTQDINDLIDRRNKKKIHRDDH